MKRLQKILLNRYGPYNIKAPTKEELDNYGLKTTRLRKPQPDLFDNIIYMLRFPPKRDRNYKSYIYSIELFMEYFNMATKQSQWQVRAQILDIHLAGKLIYMNNHPNMYHGFQNFKYTWLSNLLFAMRTYVITRKYNLGEINSHNTTEPWSAWFVPFPRPMGLIAGGLLADNLYELMQPRVDVVLAKSTL